MRATAFTSTGISNQPTRDHSRNRDEIPESFGLDQNYPNPFNPSTVIRYQLPERAFVRLEIFNMLGQHVALMVDEEQEAGYREAVWNGSTDFGVKVASEMYYYRVTAGNFTDTKRMLLLK